MNNNKYTSSLNSILTVNTDISSINDLNSPYEQKDYMKDSLMFLIEQNGSSFRYISCQGQLLEKFGYEFDALDGKTLEECYSYEFATRRASSFKQAWEGNAVAYEDELNGVPYLGAVSPVYDEAGNVKQLQGFCFDISAQKKSEQQLREREHYFRTLYRYHPDGIFTLNKRGHFMFMNPAGAQMAGYKSKELAQKHFLPLIAPEERSNAKIYFKRASEGHVLNFETTILHKNGSRLPVQVTNIPIMIDDTIHSIYGIVKDLTKHKEYEKELSFVKDRLSATIQHSADAIAIFDMNDRLINVNPTFESFYGWKAEELIGYFVRHIPIEMKESYYSLVENVKKGTKYTGIETIRMRKDGSRFYVGITMFPLEDENGKIIGYSTVARDINAQKLAQEALRESNEHYRIITENTLDLISVFNRDGMLLYASPSHETILGYDTANFKTSDLKAAIHPDDLPAVKETFKEMIIRKDSCKVDFRVQHADGHWLCIESLGMSVLNSNGEVESFVAISRDITDRRQTEDFLRKSEKLTVLGQLAAGIAHEIRNPLTSLKGFTHILKAKSSEEDMEYFKIMLSELDRINTIVGEFMMLAKPQPRNVKANNLNQLLTEVVALLEAQANLHSVEVSLESSPLPEQHCEADQLKQVFINIMKNAIESMESGGGTLTIWTEKTDDCIKIHFSDEGCGIPEEKQAQIGEPFYTTKEKGTGLGMMICSKIIENHNGKIEIDSKVNEGTTVTIRLPIR
ncbi:PAS domain-containing sensor histidine kinase [Alkalihalobacillus sp. AL-G]|uniref:PAS domain-containing sensor histidine kinase n=1 Tax=Alkalihalobacillus sp. AL-G TaxID=2926399 RepID=UPI00272B0634|nr:PAS domain-containing sensor histidine kinase [Alkalihalobacillus sp. AL-G]WLD93176.1 PAS domain S-box protein [Alkalihalobacillus sp. AL-G]